jgi:Raf kinase inhibitor-like YbhB/YbcL family protein
MTTPRTIALGALLALAALLLACEEDEDYPAIELRSLAFGDGETIPERHTCDGADISPPLSVAGADAATRSYALVLEDPVADGGRYTHWLLWGWAADERFLAEGQPIGDHPRPGLTQGTNSADVVGYAGPCPPEEPDDIDHRYIFKVYALDYVPELAPGAGRSSFEGIVDGHILGVGQLTGVYERER